ncbi:TetR/AcrR family transcriptional regulator [Flavobacterium sp. 3HN19-14]|uniref:TetR/AcrR family transcriptional regulator n=1 Tax=Flavobacterium sp. 3HN19-14 TaxID=3448133 RepID=UPI003EDF8C6C
MKDKIIAKATEMFLKLGFKSITMDDIAGEMCISKKTIYKYFINKEVLIEESTETLHKTVYQIIEEIISKDYNAIEENFEIKKMFKGVFQSAETSPLYQLKKHYPEIYQKVISQEYEECSRYMKHNIQKGIDQGLFRKNIDIEMYSQFHYILTFSINENTRLEKEAERLELGAIEYHMLGHGNARRHYRIRETIT